MARSARAAVLAVPTARRMVISTTVFRAAGSMDWLVLLLAVTASAGVRPASTVLVALGVGAALGGPLAGRMADRTSPRLVLTVTAVVYPCAYLLTAWTASSGRVTAACFAAFTAGALAPPVTACCRAAWSTVLPDGELRSAAFALDVLVMEVVEVAGPLLAAAALLVSPQLAAAVVATGTCTSALLLAMALPPTQRRPTMHAQGPTEEVPAGPRGAALRITAATALVSAALAAMPVSAAAFGARGHSAGYAAAWVALSAAGSLAGVLLVGSWLDRWSAGRRLPVHMLTVAAGAALMAAGSSMGAAAFAMTAFVGSFGLGPMFAAVFEALDAAAPEGSRAQAHALLGTAGRLGDASGSGASGALASTGPVFVLVLAATSGLLAAAACLPPRRARVVGLRAALSAASSR